MKNIFKNIVTIIILSFSIIQTSNAFQHMDVCNYTYWDYSGDYYDRLCTEDWLPSEDSPMYSSTTKTSTDTTNTTSTVKKDTVHDLRDVKHTTGSSFPLSDWYYNIDRDKEIEELKVQLLKNNLLLEEYKNKTNKLLENQENLLDQTVLPKNHLDESVPDKQTIKYTKTPIKKTIKYTNTPMEDIVVDQSVTDLIRERIERNNLRNALKNSRN